MRKREIERTHEGEGGAQPVFVHTRQAALPGVSQQRRLPIPHSPQLPAPRPSCTEACQLPPATHLERNRDKHLEGPESPQQLPHLHVIHGRRDACGPRFGGRQGADRSQLNFLAGMHRCTCWPGAARPAAIPPGPQGPQCSARHLAGGLHAPLPAPERQQLCRAPEHTCQEQRLHAWHRLHAAVCHGCRRRAVHIPRGLRAAVHSGVRLHKVLGPPHLQADQRQSVLTCVAL